MMTVTKMSVMDCDELRKLCIQHQFFTRGTVEEYNDMFDKAREYNTAENKDEQLEAVARCIMQYSTGESLTNFAYSGMTHHAIVCDLMTKIKDDCVTEWYE